MDDFKHAADCNRAPAVRIAICDDKECTHPHLMLLDQKGEVFAEAVLGDDILIALSAFSRMFSAAGKSVGTNLQN